MLTAFLKSLLTFIRFTAGFPISIGIGFTVVGTSIPEALHLDAMGLAMGGYNSALYIGMLLSSLVMGTVIQESGFKNGFLYMATSSRVSFMSL